MEFTIESDDPQIEIKNSIAMLEMRAIVIKQRLEKVRSPKGYRRDLDKLIKVEKEIRDFYSQLTK